MRVKAIILQFKFIFLLFTLYGCHFSNFNNNLHNNVAPFVKGDTQKIVKKTIVKMIYNGKSEFTDSIWIFSVETNSFLLSKMSILQKGDIYFLVNNTIITKNGFIIDLKDKDSLQASPISDSIPIIIKWNPVLFFVSPQDEFYILAKKDYNDDINYYISEIFAKHNAILFKQFISRYTFNQPTTEQFSELLFPLATSIADNELHQILFQLDEKTKIFISEGLILDDGIYSTEFKRFYMKHKFPISFKYMMHYIQ